MQADGGFIEDIEHAEHGRTDLGRQADALGLAPGKAGAGPIQAQVVETDVGEEGQSFANFDAYPPGHIALSAGSEAGSGIVQAAFKVREENLKFSDGKRVELMNRAPINTDAARFGS